MEEKQTKLETENKKRGRQRWHHSVAERDTRHRRMQEVNSLSTDSGPLRVNTVLCHSTQYNILVITE